MSDKEIIFNFLVSMYDDSDTVIYLYCCGNVRSGKRAVKIILDHISPVFQGAINTEIVEKNIIYFLDFKKNLYEKNMIKIKPFY